MFGPMARRGWQRAYHWRRVIESGGERGAAGRGAGGGRAGHGCGAPVARAHYTAAVVFRHSKRRLL